MIVPLATTHDDATLSDASPFRRPALGSERKHRTHSVTPCQAGRGNGGRLGGIGSGEVKSKMPIAEQVAVDVGEVTLIEAGGSELPLGALSGAQVLVLLRHRH